MDVIAHGAFEGLDIEAHRTWRNPRQYSSRLAHGAKWSSQGDHMLSPLVQAGALQNSQSPVDTRGGGDGISLEPFAIPPLFHFAHFRKVNAS